MKNFFNLRNKYLKYYISLFIIILLIFTIIFSCLSIKQNQSYSLFIEFNDAYGLQIGTSVHYKGIKIGYISKINIYFNKVVVLIKIKSSDTILPKQSLFEANQTGLFNDRVINITTLDNNFLHDSKQYYNLPKRFSNLEYILPNSYIKGYKGINYDDLIRSTTRISQRFDDPRFFNLFYLLIQNSIEVSDEFLFLINNLSDFVFYFLYIIYIYISGIYF